MANPVPPALQFFPASSSQLSIISSVHTLERASERQSYHSLFYNDEIARLWPVGGCPAPVTAPTWSLAASSALVTSRTEQRLSYPRLSSHFSGNPQFHVQGNGIATDAVWVRGQSLFQGCQCLLDFTADRARGFRFLRRHI